jgi:hypothetical protein
VGTLAPGAAWQSTLTFTFQPDNTGVLSAPAFGSDLAGIRLRLGDQVYSELHRFTVTYQ